MKPLWRVCAGSAGLVVLISAVIHVQSSSVVGGDKEQTSAKEVQRSSRGHNRAEPRDGAADLKFEKMPAGEKREITLRRLVARRAADDPATAERWAESIKLDSEREVALNHLAVAWGKTNPIMALGLAERHHLSQGIVETISQQWGKTDPQAAMRWALGLPSKQEQENALSQIFSAHAEIDPADAARLVSERLPPGPGQDEAVMTVLYHWLRVDEAAAVSWAENFADGELKVRAETEIRGFRSYRAAASTDQQQQNTVR